MLHDPAFLPITKLPGNAPLGPIIPAGDLADYIEASEIIEQAREQAKSIIQDGEKKSKICVKCMKK